MPGKRAPEEERREEMLDAALSLAAERGLETVTLRTVAQRCGLSAGLVSFHFGTKEGLLRAMLDRLIAIGASIEGFPSGSSHPADAFAQIVVSEVRRLRKSAKLVDVFFEFWTLSLRRAAFRNTMRQALVAYRREFQEYAERALRGSPRRFEGDAEGLAALAVSYVQGAALQAALDPKTLPVLEAQRMFLQTCESLNAAAARDTAGSGAPTRSRATEVRS